MYNGGRTGAASIEYRDVSDKVKGEAEAREAVSGLQQSLESAKQLVERTRSLLSGEIAYDEGEIAMVAAEAASAQPADVDPESPAG